MIAGICLGVGSSAMAGGIIPLSVELDTEIVSMDLTADTPLPIQVSESATEASTGKTTITDLGGGVVHVESFFDVYFELTVGASSLEDTAFMELGDQGAGYDWTPGTLEPIPPVGGTYMGHPVMTLSDYQVIAAMHTVTGPGTVTLLDPLTVEEEFPSLLELILEPVAGGEPFSVYAEGPTVVHVTIPEPGTLLLLVPALALLGRRK